MGLWNMLTQANEKEGKRGRGTKRHTQRIETKKKSCGGNTVAAAVVFHCSLERVGVLLSLGAGTHVWSHDHQSHVIQKFMGAHCFQKFGKRMNLS